MERININGKYWQKYIGDEGQDVFVAEFIESDESILGKYADDTFYDILIDKDTDFYLKPNCDPTQFSNCDKNCLNCSQEDQVAFKFRKNVFTEEEQLGALEGLWGAARESHNRGMAAGQRDELQGKRTWVTGKQEAILKYFEEGKQNTVDGTDILQMLIDSNFEEETTRNSVWLRDKVVKEFGTYDDFFDLFIEKIKSMSINSAVEYSKFVQNTMISKTNYAKAIWSGIAGFYGRYPRIPYGRETAYVEQNRELFERCYPFAKKLDKEFAKLLPIRYARQKNYSDKIDKRFLIGEETTFTTITVNTTTQDRNARMSCHRDAGSLNSGFSNLTVISKEGMDWEGGYLVCPEVRTAINVRPGDLLLIDNMRIIHGNTPIEKKGDKELLRMSLVFYFREDMENLGSWEYEKCRKQFVFDRKNNQDHKFWKPYWNGVSPGMWKENEWYEYLENNMGEEALKQYHPEFFVKESTLESFF